MLTSSRYYQYRSVATGIYSEKVEVSNVKSQFSHHSHIIFLGTAIGVFLSIIFSFNIAIQYADSTSQSV
ncbi:MAG: DUF6773 family protein [Bacillus sp. (in: firmicutes)]